MTPSATITPSATGLPILFLQRLRPLPSPTLSPFFVPHSLLCTAFLKKPGMLGPLLCPTFVPIFPGTHLVSVDGLNFSNFLGVSLEIQ